MSVRSAIAFLFMFTTAGQALAAPDGKALARKGWEARHRGESQRALTYFHQACFDHHPQSCQDLADLGRILGDDRATREGLEEACRYQLHDSCTTLAVLDRTKATPALVTSIGRMPGNCTPENLARCNDLGQAKLKAGATSVAIRYFEVGCHAGDGVSCDWLGRAELDAHRTAEADRHFRRACELGAAAGCLSAVASAEREGHATDAAKYRSLACDMGAAEACRQIVAKSGPAGSHDALTFMRKACLAGDAKACCSKQVRCDGLDALTCFRLAEKTKANCGDASQLFAEACAKGETLACRGDIKRSDTAGALCKGGSAAACQSLADDELKAGKQDDALVHLRRACELKATAACTRVAMISGDDKGGSLAAACKNRDGKACYYLGQALKKGGQAREAQRYLDQACALGFGLTCDAAAKNSRLAH